LILYFNRVDNETKKSCFNLNKDLLINKNLNELQKEAVLKATETDDFYLIHGPPGTGKTVTMVEIAIQLILQKQKVIFCGPSNSSVDNFLNKLLKFIDNYLHEKKKLNKLNKAKFGKITPKIIKR
jgi:superfamily I DNA and/or RNA helicase